jgi:hypothetical protein
MDNLNKYFTHIYDRFNQRDVDFVISNMTADVKWANGMDGGYVYGHEGVREYWTRQFKLISSQVTPLEVREQNGKVVIRVHQVVHDLEGTLVADATVIHVFTMDGDKIVGFDITPTQ